MTEISELLQPAKKTSGGDLRGHLTLIKVGGKIVEEPESLKKLLADFSSIPGHKVLVHGGGLSATALAAQLGI